MDSLTVRAQAFGTLLRRHRLAAGLSQVALAEKAGLSARGLSDLERSVRHGPYPATVARLADALGLDADGRAALVAAARRDPPAAEQDAPPARLGPPLPVPLSSFVGRERALEEIRGLLRATRLLTLTGSGGVGKTRLALEVARGTVDAAWTPAFVELAPLVDGASVPQVIATVLDVQERPGRPLVDTLAEAIGPRAILLVLDNCEHLVDRCAELAERLLQACPRLRLLATSREPLGVVGEAIWRVPSLEMPDGVEAAPLEQIGQIEAVRLFVERAGLVLPGFKLTERDVRPISQICRRLDGVPLAIELAAARIAVLSAEQIAARLDDRFALLSGGGRTAPRRQRTLRETVEWSYGLLSAEERSLFDRLSVFAGGWSLEAVEAVMASPTTLAEPGVPTAPRITEGSALDLLTSLVNKSLVQAEPTSSGPFRYRILETLRQYGRERLEASGQAEIARRQHAAYYLALAESAEPELRGPRQDAWLARLEEEHDNLRAALAWSRSPAGDAELGLRLAGALGWFWYIHGHASEGRRQLGTALEAAPTGSVGARARALGMAGFLARLQGEPGTSSSLLEESLRLHRTLGDRWGEAFVLNGLGMVARRRGEYARAVALCEEGQALFEELGDRWGVAWTLVHVGEAAAERGDATLAVPVLHRALSIARELHNRQISAWSLSGLARIAEAREAYDEAATLAEEGLALFRELGDPRGVALLLGVLAGVAQARNDQEAALARSAASLHLRHEIGDLGGVAEVLERLAIGLLEVTRAGGPSAGRPDREALARRAVGHLGAADALRAAASAPVPLMHREVYARVVRAARAVLTPEAYEAAWDRGQQLSAAQAVEEGLGHGGATGRGGLWP
jgi:predicted ATPase